MQTAPPASAPRPFRGRLSGFVKRRINKTLGYGLIGALLGVTAGAVYFGPDVAAGWSILTEAGKDTFLSDLRWFLLIDLLPVTLAITTVTLIGFGLAGLAGAVLTTLLRPGILTFVDGAAWTAAFIVAARLTGIADWLETMLSTPMAPYLAVWIFFIAMFGTFWDRLPFGFTFSTRVSRIIDMPVEAVRPRLIPGAARSQTLADAAIRQDFGADLPAGFDPVAIERRGDDRCRVDEAPARAPWRQLTYTIREPAPGQTRLDIEIRLNSLSPMALWDLWTRPYGEDYADHLTARLAATKDRSTYGRLVKKTHRKLERKTARRPADA